MCSDSNDDATPTMLQRRDDDAATAATRIRITRNHYAAKAGSVVYKSRAGFERVCARVSSYITLCIMRWRNVAVRVRTCVCANQCTTHTHTEQ